MILLLMKSNLISDLITTKSRLIVVLPGSARITSCLSSCLVSSKMVYLFFLLILVEKSFVEDLEKHRRYTLLALCTLKLQMYPSLVRLMHCIYISVLAYKYWYNFLIIVPQPIISFAIYSLDKYLDSRSLWLILSHNRSMWPILSYNRILRSIIYIL